MKITRRITLTATVLCIALALAALVCAQSKAAPSLTRTSDSLSFVITSKALGENRHIRIHLPLSYSSSNQHYPVVFVFDGESLMPTAAAAAEFLHGYSTIPQMPEVILVGVVNVDRNRDMPIPGEYGKGREQRFLAFLADELAPAVQTQFRTQPLHIVTGHSQGGLFSLFALVNRPDVFQWCLSLDAPFAGFPEIAPLLQQAVSLLTKSDGRRHRFVSAESLYGWKNQWPFSGMDDSISFVQQVKITNETHETMAFKGLYDGLKALFHDYAPNIIRDTRISYTLPILQKRYDTLSDLYGYPVDIPAQLLLVSANRSIAEQKGTQALALIDWAIKLYGDSPRTQELRTRAEDAGKKGWDSRLDEWAALPPPTADQIAPFAGAWEHRVEDGARWYLTFQVVDGMVRQQLLLVDPSGERYDMQLHFVRVVDNETLQWGVRNGRGPGVTVHYGRLVDSSTITGSTEQVGYLIQHPPEEFIYRRIPVENVP